MQSRTERGICSPFVIVLFYCSLCFATHLSSENNDINGEHQASQDSSKHIKQFIKEELDVDKDGLVSKKEMVDKMEKSFSQQRQSEMDELINKYDINYDNRISWKEFMSITYPDEALRYSDDLENDKKKFNIADVDQDGLLHSKEFASFYFPGAGNEDIIEYVMDNWLRNVDLNRDGFVTIDEFLASQSEGKPDSRDQRTLREHFNEDYDMNKDGKIDRDELKEWLAPTRASAMRRAKRILKLADNNGDGHLSMEEIIENDCSVRPLLHEMNYTYKDEL